MVKKKKTKTKQRMGKDPLSFIAPTTDVVEASVEVEEKPTETAFRGRPRTNFRTIARTSQKGVPEGWERATYVMRDDHIKFLRDIAWLDRKMVKTVIEEAVELYIKKHGERVAAEIKRIKEGAPTS